ncbi:MAG: pyridoxamine 5-phosphate oxidase [Rhizobiales bacterium]|nr:pyridoxamine 5-phosphate oxidase [Hyphomicrobiales bacterium]
MDHEIRDIAALESCVGRTPGPMHLKVIDHLDAGAIRWLAASPLLFAGFGSGADIGISLAGGRPGFVDVVDASKIRLPKAFLDSPEVAHEGKGFGALSLIPTIGESLRINGRVNAVDLDAIEIQVEECYIHCAKALIRSDFWNARPQPTTPSEPAEFLAASRFVALATADGEGHGDVSPKGDPAGMMIRLFDGAVWFADRPGNRRTDSFRNMLSQPRVAVAVLIPGAIRVALLRGEARLTQGERARTGFAVQGKTPLLATRIERPEIMLIDSAAIARARLWPANAPNPTIAPAAMITAHVKLSKERSLQATLVRAAVSVPGLMQKGLDRDYKSNLY